MKSKIIPNFFMSIDKFATYENGMQSLIEMIKKKSEEYDITAASKNEESKVEKDLNLGLGNTGIHLVILRFKKQDIVTFFSEFPDYAPLLTSLKNKRGVPPICFAAMNKNISDRNELMKYLLTLTLFDARKPLITSAEDDSARYYAEIIGVTLLHLAAMSLNLENLQQFITANNINNDDLVRLRTLDGYSPIHYAPFNEDERVFNWIAFEAGYSADGKKKLREIIEHHGDNKDILFIIDKRNDYDVLTRHILKLLKQGYNEIIQQLIMFRTLIKGSKDANEEILVSILFNMIYAGKSSKIMEILVSMTCQRQREFFYHFDAEFNPNQLSLDVILKKFEESSENFEESSENKELERFAGMIFLALLRAQIILISYGNELRYNENKANFRANLVSLKKGERVIIPKTPIYSYFTPAPEKYIRSLIFLNKIVAKSLLLPQEGLIVKKGCEMYLNYIKERMRGIALGSKNKEDLIKELSEISFDTETTNSQENNKFTSPSTTMK